MQFGGVFEISSVDSAGVPSRLFHAARRLRRVPGCAGEFVAWGNRACGFLQRFGWGLRQHCICLCAVFTGARCSSVRCCCAVGLSFEGFSFKGTCQ
jgi:hypothetical protein